MAGQISLCQATFAAIGAFATAQLATRSGRPVLVAIVIGAVIAAVVGALLAIPVLRLGGIYLSLATLRVRVDLRERHRAVRTGSAAARSPIEVPRPVIGPIDFAKATRSFFFLCLVVLIVVSDRS